MRFLKLLLLLLLIIAGVAFSYRNWRQVELELWGGMVLDINLPLLLAVTFFAGLIPYFLMHRATRWSLKRKLESVERSLTEMRNQVLPKSTSQTAPESPTMLSPVEPMGTIPPVAAPIAVPPGVS